MEALQGYKSGCSATSAGMGDIGEQLYWGDDCKLDFKQSAEAISVLCYPFLKSRNFCFLAIGTAEERRIWSYQAQRLTSLGFSILSEYSECNSGAQDITTVTYLAMRILVMLTDLKGWKGITDDNRLDADLAVKGLVEFTGSKKSGSYVSIARYISALDNYSSQMKVITQADEKFVITASAITLAVRPFYLTNSDGERPDMLNVNHGAMQYIVYLMTIPWLVQHLPPVLLPALKHKSILFTCF
ncbi:E3 ubiquitin-protein ligase UPL7-like, partial [Trifolium medium]|nr:E3 ubiquitin-protein ligase UPL7-like [Trifolium medium]